MRKEITLSKLIETSVKYNPKPKNFPDYLIMGSDLLGWIKTYPYRGKAKKPYHFQCGGWVYCMTLLQSVND